MKVSFMVNGGEGQLVDVSTIKIRSFIIHRYRIRSDTCNSYVLLLMYEPPWWHNNYIMCYVYCFQVH